MEQQFDMNHPIIGYMPFIVIGFFVLMALIIVPIVIRKTRKARKKSKDFLPGLCRKLGLQQTENGAVGDYQGFHIELAMEMGMNKMRAAESVMRQDMSHMHGRQSFYPIVRVWLTAHEEEFPDIRLYQPMSWWRHHQKISDKLDGREPDNPEMAVDASVLQKGAKFYGFDEGAARRLAASDELRNQLRTWAYTDLRMEGDTVMLELNNNNILNEFGKRLQSNDYLIQAVNICVATARTLQA